MSTERVEKKKHVEYSFSILTGGVEVNFFSKTEIEHMIHSQRFESASEYLPGSVDVRKQIFKSSRSFDVLIENSEELLLEVLDLNRYLLKGPVMNDNFINQIPYVAYTLGEKIRQENALVTIHAAATSINNKGVLILGDKGSGKTSTAISLCKHGHSLVGNDLVVLGFDVDGGLCVFSGTKALDIRKPVSDNLSLNLQFSSETKNPYEQKQRFHLKTLGIKSSEIVAPISLVVRVNVHDRSNNLDISSFNRNSEILRLRENMSRYIRGTTTPIMISETNWGYFPSMDNINLSKKRDLILQRIFETQFLYISSNNPQTVSEHISSIVEQN